MESFEAQLEKKIGTDLLENLGFGFFRLSISGKLIYANKAFISLLEYENLEELKSDLANNSSLKLCLNAQRLSKHSNDESEFVWITKSKKKKVLKEFIQKVKEGNGFLFFDCIVQDITEKTFLEKLIKDIHSNDASILKAIPDYILVVSKNYEIVENKNNLQNIFPEFPSLQGLFIKDIFDETIAFQLEKLVADVISTNEQKSYEFAIDDLEKKYFEARIVQRNHEEAIIILRDISREKIAEEQLKTFTEELKQTNATKDKFFSIIAHDLRTPLNGILNYAEILSNEYNELSKEEIKEFADYILEISRSTNNLLNNLLEWARIQNGKINFEPERNNLYNVAEKVLSMLQLVASNKNIEIQNKIDKNLNAIFDKNMINSILLNLTNNAIKFSNAGGKIELFSEEFDNYYKISVKDNGIGMTDEIASKLFNSNFAVTTPGTAKEKGTGLGLILCKEFVKRHKGNIWVESKVGTGSTFSFTISKKIF